MKKRNEAYKPRLIIFSTGMESGGGSGAKQLMQNAACGMLQANIVAVVSSHEWGGVRTAALQFHRRFIHFTGPYTAEAYEKIIAETGAEWVLLSGWLKPFHGYDPRRVVNKHPGILPQFGGRGMYGIRIHEEVLRSFRKGGSRYTSFSMHFVVDERHTAGDFYDRGPVFFQSPPIWLSNTDTPEKLQEAVKTQEHVFETPIVNLVIDGQIRWEDVNDPTSIIVPENYPYLPRKSV